MIKNWELFNKNMHFENIRTGDYQPYDIDLCYINSSFMVLGEIKHEYGTFQSWQREKYQTIIDNMNIQNAIVIFITYSEKIEDVVRDIDVSKCKVKEYYLKGLKGWHKPKKPTSVQEVFDYMRNKYEL